MNHLEERLRTAGRAGTGITPDLDSIRARGLRIRRTRQVGASLAVVALVAVGGIASLNFFQPPGETTILSGSEGEVSSDAAEEQPDPTDEVQKGEPADDTDPVDESPKSTTDEDSEDSAEEIAEAVEVESGDAESAGADAATTADEGPPMPTPGSVADGSGGWLTATSDGLVHLHADETTTRIDFADPEGGSAQRWPTDVVSIDGNRYLLVDQFVNRSDLEAERTQALADNYGIDYDPDGDGMSLYSVATPEELDALNHWEVSILAVDLTTDDVITVETRVINSVQSPDWFYNGHMTSDGSNIMVMRELWQGHCLYAEGLTLTGQTVDIVDAKIYAKPQGLDTMSFDDVGAVFSMEVDPPQPCRTLEELPESGLGVWGTQADRAQMEAFRTAFFEAGLG